MGVTDTGTGAATALAQHGEYLPALRADIAIDVGRWFCGEWLGYPDYIQAAFVMFQAVRRDEFRASDIALMTGLAPGSVRWLLARIARHSEMVWRARRGVWRGQLFVTASDNRLCWSRHVLSDTPPIMPHDPDIDELPVWMFYRALFTNLPPPHDHYWSAGHDAYVSLLRGHHR